MKIIIVMMLMLSGCTTIHVLSEGDVVIDAHKEVITDTDAGL